MISPFLQVKSINITHVHYSNRSVFLSFPSFSSVFSTCSPFFPDFSQFSLGFPSIFGDPQRFHGGSPRGTVVTYLFPDESTAAAEERRLGGLLDATATAGMAETNGAADDMAMADGKM